MLHIVHDHMHVLRIQLAQIAAFTVRSTGSENNVQLWVIFC